MRAAILSLVLLTSCVAQQLTTEDRLHLREAQLQLAQTHIALQQAQMGVVKAEQALSALIEKIKAEKGCPDCTINQNLELVPPAKPQAAPDEGRSEEKEKDK